MIEACNELIFQIEETAHENKEEFKVKIKELMIKALDFNKDILGYGTKRYFIKAMNRWRQNGSLRRNIWLIPCLEDIKYACMPISERPMIPGVDDLVNDLTYEQLLAEVNLLR